MKAKHKFSEIFINNISFPNKGIGTYEGQKVIVKNSIPGQKIYCSLSKKKGIYHGRKIELLEKSTMEIEPQCKDFSICGGCTFQNISYLEELKLKEKMTLALLNNQLIKDAQYSGIVSAPSYGEYRNKMEYSFGDNEKGGILSLGMRKRESFYEVVTSEKCNIVDEDFRKIIKLTLEFFRSTDEKFYHKGTHQGSLRHLIVRKGFFTGEILINLVTTPHVATDLSKWVHSLMLANFSGNIVGILHTINSSVSDAVICDSMSILWGKDFFYDKLFSMKFKISPFSFFQTNSGGAEKLYETVLEFSENCANKTIFDLYCGTGTIAQVLSNKAKQVIGIELVPQAVEAAKHNAINNNITNCHFIAGDVLKEVENLTQKPDIVILDPPREGVHPKALGKIITFNAPILIYVSCNPVSLARDIEVLCNEGYFVKKIRLHDMFPRTGHVETVVLLSKLKSTKSIEVQIELDEMDLTTAESKATYAEVKQYVLDNV